MRHWPDTLPTPIGPGYGLEVVDQYLRSDMEVGPARTRRLTRARRDRVQAVWVMSPVEFQAFRAWFEGLRWSLAGHSDELIHWTPWRTSWAPGMGLTPSGVLSGRVLETAETSQHWISCPVAGLADGATGLFTISARAAGRSLARVIIVGRDGVGRRLDVDLATGAGSNASNLMAWSVTSRGNGWWRIAIRATVGTGLNTALARVQMLQSPGVTNYLGDAGLGVDLAECNVRIPTGADLYLPTDATGAARGAAGGPAWAMIPVFTGGAVTPVECRFERTFTTEVKPGLNVHVSAPLEVRHA